MIEKIFEMKTNNSETLRLGRFFVAYINLKRASIDRIEQLTLSKEEQEQLKEAYVEDIILIITANYTKELSFSFETQELSVSVFSDAPASYYRHEYEISGISQITAFLKVTYEQYFK